jgi:hypothetical protein
MIQNEKARLPGKSARLLKTQLNICQLEGITSG